MPNPPSTEVAKSQLKNRLAIKMIRWALVIIVPIACAFVIYRRIEDGEWLGLALSVGVAAFFAWNLLRRNSTGD